MLKMTPENRPYTQHDIRKPNKNVLGPVRSKPSPPKNKHKGQSSQRCQCNKNPQLRNCPIRNLRLSSQKVYPSINNLLRTNKKLKSTKSADAQIYEYVGFKYQGNVVMVKIISNYKTDLYSDSTYGSSSDYGSSDS